MAAESPRGEMPHAEGGANEKLKEILDATQNLKAVEYQLRQETGEKGKSSEQMKRWHDAIDDLTQHLHVTFQGEYGPQPGYRLPDGYNTANKDEAIRLWLEKLETKK